MPSKEEKVDKTIPTPADAVAAIPDGAALMIGGFGGSGAPIELIHALIDRFKATGSPRDLSVINNNAGNGKIGIAAMIDADMVRKMVCSFPRSSDPRAFTEKYLAGEIELELVPQGTLAERIRAGGAGIPAFFNSPIAETRFVTRHTGIYSVAPTETFITVGVTPTDLSFVIIIPCTPAHSADLRIAPRL